MRAQFLHCLCWIIRDRGLGRKVLFVSKQGWESCGMFVKNDTIIFPWYMAFTAVTVIFIFLCQLASLYCEECVNIFVSDCVEMVRGFPLLPNDTDCNIFAQIGSIAKC